ncbi:MAG: hypothetical protein JSV33_05830 [bacterium]|nr:MAG: hypothetical protein JSV33_05830 [bacterium]
MRNVIVVAAIAIIHLVLALGSAMATFEVAGFFFGVYPQPSDGILHTALKMVHTILMLPLGLVALSLGPSARFLAWPLMVLNSLLWGILIYYLATHLSEIRKAKWMPLGNQ